MYLFTSLTLCLGFVFGLWIGIVLGPTDTGWSRRAILKRPGGKEPGSKKRRSNLSPRRLAQYQEQIETYLQSEKPYLDSDFRMRTMAEATGIPRHHLSMTINTVYGMNFNKLINKYRINYFLRHLNAPEWEPLTFEGMAMEAGFKSRSTFQNAFKKFTGTTPSKFRKNLAKEFA